MAKGCADAVIDALLNKIATSTHQTVCSSLPANYAGIAAVALAAVTMTAGAGNGDYAIADDSSGRKLTMTAKSAVSITASATATYVTLDDGVTLLAWTTCTSQALVSGGTVDIPSWKWNTQDPT